MAYIRDVNGYGNASEFAQLLILKAETLDNMCEGLRAKVIVGNAIVEGEDCKLWQLEGILAEISQSIKDRFFISFEDEGEYGRIYFDNGKFQYCEADIVYKEPTDNDWQ